MNELKIFLFGFALWYAIQIADILVNLLTSYINIIVTKNNNKINEYTNDEQQMNAIGFRYDFDEDEYYFDDEDDCE